MDPAVLGNQCAILASLHLLIIANLIKYGRDVRNDIFCPRLDNLALDNRGNESTEQWGELYQNSLKMCLQIYFAVKYWKIKIAIGTFS